MAQFEKRVVAITCSAWTVLAGEYIQNLIILEHVYVLSFHTFLLKVDFKQKFHMFKPKTDL